MTQCCMMYGHVCDWLHKYNRNECHMIKCHASLFFSSHLCSIVNFVSFVSSSGKCLLMQDREINLKYCINNIKGSYNTLH